MFIYGGYMPETASFLKDIYCLDLEKLEWSVLYEHKDEENEP